MQEVQRVRHVAHLRRAVRLDALLLAPPSGLRAQARAGGLAGGFGAGWYPSPDVGRPGTSSLPRRRAQPLCTDAGLPALAGAVTSGRVLAAARSAPDGAPADGSACPPSRLGDVLLSHDGGVPGVAATLGRLVPSGPGDGDAGWEPVADRSLVAATLDGVEVTAL